MTRLITITITYQVFWVLVLGWYSMQDNIVYEDYNSLTVNKGDRSAEQGVAVWYELRLFRVTVCSLSDMC